MKWKKTGKLGNWNGGQNNTNTYRAKLRWSKDFTQKKTLRFQVKDTKAYTMLMAIIDNTDLTAQSTYAMALNL